MGDAPFFTIVSAVYNLRSNGRLETFAQAFHSVQSQGFEDFEHLIIDGASSDGTLDAIASLMQGEPRAKLSSARDGGVFDAMNRGARLAKGKVILFLNSDDYYHDASGLGRVADRFRRMDVDFVCSPVEIEGPGRVAMDVDTRFFGRVFFRMPFGHPGLAVTKSTFDRLGGFDLNYAVAADYDFIQRLIFSGARAAVLPEPFVTFRLGGLSSNLDMVRSEKTMIWKKNYAQFGGLSDSDAAAMNKTGDVPFLLLLRAAFGRHPFAASARLAALVQLARLAKRRLRGGAKRT